MGAISSLLSTPPIATIAAIAIPVALVGGGYLIQECSGRRRPARNQGPTPAKAPQDSPARAAESAQAEEREPYCRFQEVRFDNNGSQVVRKNVFWRDTAGSGYVVRPGPVLTMKLGDKGVEKFEMPKGEDCGRWCGQMARDEFRGIYSGASFLFERAAGWSDIKVWSAPDNPSRAGLLYYTLTFDEGSSFADEVGVTCLEVDREKNQCLKVEVSEGLYYFSKENAQAFEAAFRGESLPDDAELNCIYGRLSRYTMDRSFRGIKGVEAMFGNFDRWMKN